MKSFAMEIRHTTLVCLLLAMLFIVGETAARPLHGSSNESSALRTTEADSKTHSEMSASSTVESSEDVKKTGILVTEIGGGAANLEDESMSYDERRMMATTSDYDGPSENDNKKHH